MKTSILRIGIVGAGNRGTNCFGRLLAQRSDAQLVAVAEPNPLRSEVASQRIGHDFARYTHADEMLQQESLDGVIVTTPDYLHADYVVAAVRAGVRHVLVDKPLATTVDDCLRVVHAINERGGHVAIGFNMRHLPFIAKVKELIEDGAIGQLMLIENREFYDGGRTYMARWNRQYRWSGGLWIHKGSHDFDVFNWWNSGGNPLRVSASAGVNALREDKIPFTLREGTPVGPNCTACAYKDVCPDYALPIGGVNLFNAHTSEVDGYLQDLCIFLSNKDTHDNGIALIEYDNNVRASHMECFVCNFTDRFYTVVGDRGTLMGNLANASQIELRPRWGDNKMIPVEIASEDEHGGADPLLLDNFIAAIRKDASASSTVRDGLRAVAVGQAAEISWRTHRTVEIAELGDMIAINSPVA
jgi:predicted dehydrogenase